MCMFMDSLMHHIYEDSYCPHSIRQGKKIELLPAQYCEIDDFASSVYNLLVKYL